MTAKPKYYWDACIFIAWIMNETRAQGEMEGLAEVVNEIDEGKAVLVTSSIVFAEVLTENLTPEQKTRYENVLKRSSTYIMDANIPVNELAGKIREHYKQKEEISIKTADAIHLATAIWAKVDAFHTFDPRLLKLSGNVIGHNLKICSPIGRKGQGLLPFNS